MKEFKPCQPHQILITREEITNAINYAEFKQWPIAPCPINSAFVVSQCMIKLGMVKIEDHKD